MASFSIHIAIGKRYIEKNHNIINEKDFYNGLVFPDLVKDKKITHYTGERNLDDLVLYLEKKVRLDKYLEENDITSDYQKGVFLHLLTDYLFFTSFLPKSYLSSVSYSEFCKDLYYSYGETTPYVEEKYNLDYSVYDKIIIEKMEKDKRDVLEVSNNILPIEGLNQFIEMVSSVDLEQVREDIIINKGKILTKVF